MFTMTGTTGSTFTGVFATSAGKIGFREIGGGQFRVRVEPNGKALALPSWKQPDSYGKRYSTVVDGVEGVVAAVAEGVAAIAAASELKTTKEVVTVVETAPYFA